MSDPRYDLVAAERQRPDETLFTLQVNEAQVRDLASGFVPRVVKATALRCLDWLDEDERRARRPQPRRKAATV